MRDRVALTKRGEDYMTHQTIAVAGTGYVGLSIATLLAQHNHVIAVDLIPEKIDLINQRISPIQDKKYKKMFKRNFFSVRKKGKFI